MRLAAAGSPIGVRRVPLLPSPALAVTVAVLLRNVVPPGSVALTSTENTTEPAVPAASAPTVNLYTEPAPPDPEKSVQPGVPLARSAVVLAGTVSVSTTPVAFVPEL